MASAVVEYSCFVGGLAWATDDRTLEDAFSPYGDILDSKVRLAAELGFGSVVAIPSTIRPDVINDRETGRSRGFGFVTFSNEKSMRDAIEGMNGIALDGRNITVNEAQSRGGGGGFSRGGGGGYGGGRREGGYGYGGRRHGGHGGVSGGYGGRRHGGYGDGGYGGGNGYFRGGGASGGDWRN